MYDLLLKFRRSVRRRFSPIQSRAVTPCKLDNVLIVPIWSHILQSQCELRGKFVVSQCSHDARRELDIFLYQIDPGSMFASSL